MNENQNDLLQKAISELKNSPTVNIKGKAYTQVSTRINIFRKYFPMATIETYMSYNDDKRVIIQAKISIDGTIVATGYAEEIRGDGNRINQTSAVENCETSSIGRALSNMGLGGSEYASAFEAENAISQQQNYNQSVNNTNQHNQQPYQHQQDFSQLTNLGLTVMQQGENLIVVGDNVFESKETIKQNGFRWSSLDKLWKIPLRQAA